VYKPKQLKTLGFLLVYKGIEHEAPFRFRAVLFPYKPTTKPTTL